MADRYPHESRSKIRPKKSMSAKERLRQKLKREALTLDELKKLSKEEREAYFAKRRGLNDKVSSRKKPYTKAKKKPTERPKQFEKHRDPGAVERMMEFERSLREAGFNKGGLANCGASMKPTQKMTMNCGGYAHKKK